MAGQVKHKQIFLRSGRIGGWPSFCSRSRLADTDALLGAIAKVLADEGIVLESSTWLLEPLLLKSGVGRSARPPSRNSRVSTYGCGRPRNWRSMTLGRPWSSRKRRCVAVEAMEGTDATIQRAGEIMRSLHGDASTLSRALTVVKIAKPHQDMGALTCQ